MATETAEPPVILYETVAPLLLEEEYVQDDFISLSPSSSGYATTEARLHTISQTVTEVSTSTVREATFRSSLTSSSAVGTMMPGMTDESQDSVGAASASTTEKTNLRHRVNSGVRPLAGDLETDFSERVVERVVDDVETDFSTRVVERVVEVEASGRPLIFSSKDDGEDFLSLKVDDLEDEILAGKEALAEEGKDMLTDIKTSAAQEAPPWARTGRAHGTWFRSPFLQLHQEIVDYCNFVAPTEEEKALRAAAVERVSDVIKSIWPSCQVKVFGSFATGLFLPTSDCDVVILESGCQKPQDGLKAIAKALNQKSLVKNLQVIGKARVPIVKFVETESTIAFDISFDVANGPDAAEFIRDAMTALPPLKPLCLVLKIFLQQRELNEVYTGGIGSYALLVMLLTHLQMHPSRRSVNNSGEPSPLESNLGILLVDFFDFYGRMLSVREVGISCRNGGRFYSKDSRGFFDSGRPYLLSVEDPQSPDNDIGKNSYNVTKVRQAFVLAHRQLTKLEVEEFPAHMGLLGRIVRMDKILMKRKSVIPESPARLNSKIRLPDAGPSFSTPALRSDPYVSGISGRSRWQDYEDDDFPRGGDPYPEPESKSSSKRKHAKEREDRGKRDGDSHKSESHHKRKREDFDHKGESSSGKARRSRLGKDPLDHTSANSSLHVSRYQEQTEQAGSTDIKGSNGTVSKQQKSGRRSVIASEDAVVHGRRTPDGKKNRWRKQNRQPKEDALEEGEIVLKDDFATLGMENEQERDDVTVGAGNGHNNHKRWFNEGRSSKPVQSWTDRRPRSPEGDVGTGRSVRKVVITKAAHKKIKYL